MGMWHYNIEGVKYDTVNDDKLKVLAKTGVVRPIDYVRKDGTQEWVRARRIKGLFTIEEIYGFGKAVSRQEVEAVPTKKLSTNLWLVLLGLSIVGLLGVIFFTFINVS